MPTTPEDEAILGDVLDRWKTAVDAHEPQRVARCFTEDAIFQGLHPYGVGRQGVADYYAAQPLGMTVTYRILETRRPADGLVLGYLSVEFSFTDVTGVTGVTDQPALDVWLSVLLTRAADGWLISHYQVSRLG
ncbi:nuclear transport factor 2 family protein [Kitasatospora sp. GAS1066B]|uniref:YybH family protein n=1 Tax=Kitasatospora sp. GAS1066B TaxID=3156271 RepID=UPI003512F0AD